MTPPTAPNPHTRVARAAVLAGVLSTAVVGVAYGIARLAGAPLIARDIAMVGGLLLLAGMPGLVFAALAAGRIRGGAVYGFLGGVAIRMPAGAVLALWGASWGLAHSPAFTQCIAAGYLVLLVIEVLVLAPAVKATAGIAPTPPAKREPNVAGQTAAAMPQEPA
ncbi:MAG: hypothetical protein ACIAXF_08925 [Phycisphaerales bacterium JB063]